MTIFFIILAIIFLVIVGASNKDTTPRIRTNRKDKTSYPPTPKVSELVKRVNTIEDYNDFESRQKYIYEKFSQDFDNKYYNRLYDIYESAFAKVSDKICNKVFHYQYIPQLDLETPLNHLRIGYKLFSPEEYKQNKRGTDPYEWNEISGNELLIGKLEDYVKEKPQIVDSLISYREIFESRMIFENKVTGLIKLIKLDDTFRVQYFNGVTNFDTHCRVLLLAELKISSIELLVKNGYDTPSKIKRISWEQLKSIKGISDKRIEKLLQAITNLR